MGLEDTFLQADPDQLATFVQEYVRREGQEDAGAVAVIASDMRDPRYLPHQVAEALLSDPAVQAAIKAVRAAFKPKQTSEVSADSILMDLEVLYQESKSARQFTAAISCKKLQAELKGLLQRDININVKHSVSTMSDAELEKLARTKTIEGEFTEVALVAEQKTDA